MDIAPERLLVVVGIHSHRVSATVAAMHPVSGDKVVAHKAIECRWGELSDKGRREALGEAVRMAADSAGIEPLSLFLSRSDTGFRSKIEVGWAQLGQEIEISEHERDWALRKAKEHGTGGDGEVVDAIPVSWTVRGRDGDQEVPDPLGKRGHYLTCQALLVTARRGYRAELAQLARGLGYELDGVIAQPVALYRGIQGSLPRRGSTLVIDHGACHTTFLVRRKEQLVHVETFAFGGDDLTRRIADALEVPLDQAEQAKREIDVAAAGHRGSTEGAQQVIWTDLQERDHRRLAAARACVDAVRTFFSERARDLRDHSYLSQTGQIHLVGRAASLAGLPAVLKEVFDLPVVIGTGEKGRSPGDEMEGLLVTGQVRVAGAMRRAQLAEQAGSLTNRASGFWSWLKRPLE